MGLRAAGRAPGGGLKWPVESGATGLARCRAGGIDAILFTAGIGENSRSLRERICREAHWLGVELDADADPRGAGRISTAGSRVSAWVIPTNEELMIARHTRNVLGVRSHQEPG